jgi:ornithine decarboxylase
MEECRHYFVNSGVYQAFGTQIFESDVEFLKGQPLLSKEEFNERIKKSQISYIWGQTCDGVDWLSKKKSYPMVEEGEWLIYRHFGAYGKAVACTFNGFPEPDNFYIN